jgi:hypothetical protein
LIAGLPNRVYVEGWTPAQKPADMAGVVVNAAGGTVAAFRTEHEGRARFTFTPVAGETYALRITEPTGIKEGHPLPEVRKSGVVLSATSDVAARQKDVVVRLAATADGAYGVALSQRGKEIAFTSVALAANRPANVTFAVPRALDGVLTATVYDSRMTPMAERLLFRQPDRKLKIQVTPDNKAYVPGDKVTLRVAVTARLTGRLGVKAKMGASSGRWCASRWAVVPPLVNTSSFDPGMLLASWTADLTALCLLVFNGASEAKRPEG